MTKQTVVERQPKFEKVKRYMHETYIDGNYMRRDNRRIIPEVLVSC